MATERVATTTGHAACMEAEQPRGCPLDALRDVRGGKEERTQQWPFHPVEKEEMTSRIIRDGLGHDEAPCAQPTAAEFSKRLVDLRPLILAVYLCQQPSVIGRAHFRAKRQLELSAAALAGDDVPDGNTAHEKVCLGTEPVHQQVRQDLAKLRRLMQQCCAGKRGIERKRIRLESCSLSVRY